MCADRQTFLTELLKVQSERFRQSRDLEFKVNIAIWTLLVLLGKHLATQWPEPHDVPWPLFGAFALIVVVGHWLLWVRPICRSQAADGKIISHCIARLRNLTQEETLPDITKLKSNPWEVAEVVMTAMILIGIAIIIGT